jgi:exopolysaccharide biosynthesis polyprenyl glycosylphosphotransferase
VGADTGGVAVPFDESRRDIVRGDQPELVIVPDREPRHVGVGDDVVIDLRTGDPVLELRPELVAPANRLVRASTLQRGLKRFVDVTLASLGIALLAPVLIAVAAAVKLSSSGPVFFRQPRVGRDGRTFTFLKFRSMYADADRRKAELQGLNEADGPIFKIKNDPRITPIGHFLRRTSLDELPQLLHVIAGHMSLVGPRPHLPEEVSAYGPLDFRRLTVQPGITCIWQVSGRSDLDFDTWVALDLEYIDTWSLWLDLKLILKTVPAVLSGKGAY